MRDLRKAVEERETDINIANLEVKLAQERRTSQLLRSQVGKLGHEISDLQHQVALLTEVDAIVPEPPEWTVEPPAGKHVGTPMLFVTDTHYGEVVDPAELHHLNAYNDAIAEQRTRAAFEGAVKMAKSYLGSHYRYEGAVVAFGGDIVTGTIHDELARTNEDPVPVTVDKAVDWLIAGLRLMREEFGRLHVVGVVGNHDRLQRKVPSKQRAKDSWTWLIYRILAREFKRHSTVTFDIPESPEALFSVYDTTFLLMHGDDDRGGSGISGAFAPVFRGAHKRSRRQLMAAKQTKDLSLAHDYQLVGHWHQRMIAGDVIVGNCLKGFDEYARSLGVAFTEPSQELMIVTPERGITFGTPIFVMDREAEGW